MSEFSTTAFVDIQVEEKSLRSSRKTVEEALGEIEVSTTASGGAMPSNRGTSTSGAMMSGGNSGRGSGQQWSEHIDLNERRNELLDDIKDSVDDGNFDRASRMGKMGGGLALGGIALGASALSNVLSNFSWPSLPKLEQPGWLPPDLPKPDWLPLGLPEPDPMPIKEPTSEYPVGSPGSEYPVAEPGSEYPVEEPGADYPLEEPGEYPLEEPTSEYPVEEPDPIEFNLPDVSGEQLLGGLAAGGAAVGGGLLGREFLKGGSGGAIGRGPGIGSSGFGIPAPSFLIGDRAAEAQRKDPSERGFIDRKLSDLVGGLGGIGGPQMMFTGGSGRLSTLAGAGARAALDSGGGESVQPVGGGAKNQNVGALADAIVKAVDRRMRGSGETDNSTEVRNTFNADIDVDAEGVTERELERAMEQAKKEAVREMERQITGRRGGGVR